MAAHLGHMLLADLVNATRCQLCGNLLMTVLTTIWAVAAVKTGSNTYCIGLGISEHDCQLIYCAAGTLKGSAATLRDLISQYGRQLLETVLGV